MVTRILGTLAVTSTLALFAACGEGGADAQASTAMGDTRLASEENTLTAGPVVGFPMDAGVIDAVFCDCRSDSDCSGGTKCLSPMGTGGRPARCANDDMTGQCR
jgi:hypothetical protein